MRLINILNLKIPSDPHVTAEMTFTAILFLSGSNPLPSRIHYWDCMSDMPNEVVFNAMRYNQFFADMSFY